MARLAIQLVDLGGEVVHFKVLPTTPLHKVASVYAERSGLKNVPLTFLINGEVLDINKCAREGNVCDGDIIDVIPTDQYELLFKKQPSQEPPKEQSPKQKKNSDDVGTSLTYMNSPSPQPKKPKSKLNESKRHLSSSSPSPSSPSPIYSSNYVRAGNMLFVANCHGLPSDDHHLHNNNNNSNNNSEHDGDGDDERNSNNEEGEDVHSQISSSCQKLKAILEEQNAQLIRVRVFLLDISYYSLFASSLHLLFPFKPLITAVQVVKLLNPHALLELEAEALLQHS